MRTLLVPFSLVALSLHAQPTFQWAGTGSNVQTPGELVTCSDIASAPDGSVYASYWVNGPRAMVGDTVVGGSFVARYDSTGRFLWARAPGVTAIAANGTNGVYVVGKFSGSLQVGASSLVANDVDGFVAKYDASGQGLWARQMGGVQNDEAMSVAVDGLGRVHVGGFFRGSATIGTSTLMATHDSTGFHATWDANGDFQWAVLAGGLNASGFLNSIVSAIDCDASGNSVMAGVFDGTGTFGSSTLSALDFTDLFLARFDAAGNCTWVQRMGGASSNIVAGVALNGASGTYLYCAVKSSSAIFGSTSFLLQSGSRTYLAYCDALGNPQWAVPVGNSFLNDWPTTLSIDPGGNAWVSGRLGGDGAFGPLTITGSGPFLAEYDVNGTALYAERPNTAQTTRHCLGAQGDHYIAGDFFGTQTFDMAAGSTVSVTLAIGYEGYLVRYSDDLGMLWMRRMGLHCPAYEYVGGLVTDAQGNVYSAGSYRSTMILCDDTLTTPFSSTGLYVSKRDANGECVWSRNIPGVETILLNQTNMITGLARDMSGNLYITGVFFNTLDFGIVQLTSAGESDLFLAKIDGNGNTLWAIQHGGSGADEARGLALDLNDDAIITGSYSESITIGNNTLSSLGLADGFVARYAPTGAPLWSTSFGGAGWDGGNQLCLDPAGNSYVIGSFSTSANVGPFGLSGSGTSDFLVAKYSPSGAPQWAIGESGAGWKKGNSIALGANGQLYVAGSFTGDLVLGSQTLTGDPNLYRAYLGTLSTDGTPLWLQQFTTSFGADAYGMAARPGGDIVLTGIFGTDLTIGGTTLLGTGGGDGWLASFTADGQNLWVQHIMGGADATDFAYGNALAVDASHIHLGGSFGDFYFTPFDQTGGTIEFTPGDPSTERYAFNAFDAYVVKYAIDQSVGAEDLPASSEEILLSPNPVDRCFTITGDAIKPGARIIVRDLTGREVMVPLVRENAQVHVDAGSLRAGVYSITLIIAAGPISLRFVKD